MVKLIFILLLNAIIGSCITTKNAATTLKPAIPLKSTVPTTVRATTAIKTTSTKKIATTTRKTTSTKKTATTAIKTTSTKKIATTTIKTTSTRKTTFRSTTATTMRCTLSTTMPSSAIATNGYAVIMGWPRGLNSLDNVELWYPGNTTACIMPLSIPNMPDNRYSVAAALLDNMIMYCGGHIIKNLEGFITNTCYSYTLGSTSASWVSAPPLIHKRVSHSMTAVNGMIVVAGGSNYLDGFGFGIDSVEVFKNGNWQDNLGWKMTIPRSMHCAVKYRDINVIVTGGWQYANIANGGSSINTVEQLDTITGQWTMVQSLNIARSAHSCVSYSKGAIEYIVVAGGMTAAGFTTSAEVFSCDTNVWAQLPSMNSGRLWHSMGILDGYPTVFGGTGTYPVYEETEYLNGTLWMKGKNLQKGRPSSAMVQITCI